MKPNEYQISSEKFVFVKNDGKLHDKELVTKPVSYLKDAFNRFKRNKASIIAAVIISVLVLFAIIGPWTTNYYVAYKDPYYAYCLPKNQLFADAGLDFWDGCKTNTYTKQSFLYYYSMGVETGNNAVKRQEYQLVETKLPNGKKSSVYEIRLDTYNAVGVIFKELSKAEYIALQEYQNETGIQVIYPMTELARRPESPMDRKDANYWYETYVSDSGTTTAVVTESNGVYTFNNIYLTYNEKDQYNSLRVEGEQKLYSYAEVMQNGNSFNVRVSYKEYYNYYHSYVLKDGITQASHLFGATNSGQDIFVCLAGGARFSFILAIVVATINLLVGAIYGAIEGYYGGKIDLIMERIIDILASIPFMIVITLLKFHMEGGSHILILFISFFLTGWIGMAGRTRMQFYRFKNQEYVLAARTLGASDKRIMFKHIFPNAIGTLVTSCVLVIPGMIFSETSLSYLGIINLESGNLTSVGTLLSKGQGYLMTYPHMIFPPAIFICLLMLSFNLFGNGLRDAFNPSLRGSEE